MPEEDNKTFAMLVTVGVIAVLLYGILTMPEPSAADQQSGNAIYRTYKE